MVQDLKVSSSVSNPNPEAPKAIIDTIRFLQHERPLQMRAEPKLKKSLIVDW